MALYIDREGGLYPADGPVINDAILGVRRTGRGYLLNYYDDPSRTGDLTALYALHGVTTPPRAIDAWPTLQHKLRQEAASAINKRLDDLGTNSTLVILIHGFNNTPKEAGDSYAAVQRRMASEGLPRGPYQILEVYWDGRRGEIPFFFIYAQPNAQFTGLALRGVLNQISAAHPVRILTHSLGTLVGCNALWNVTSTMGGSRSVTFADSNLQFWPALNYTDASGREQGHYYQQDCRDVVNYNTPTHPDIRLGSIAPAIPGQTYRDYLDRTPALKDNKGLYRRVVVSFNSTDKVLKKFWVGSLLNKKLGYTGLGAKRTDFPLYVAPMLNTLSTGGKSYQVTFFRCKKKKRFNHGLTGYAEAEEMSYFLKLLLSDDTTPSVCP